MATDPKRWLAVDGPGDYVILMPVEGATGPDVFVKLSDYQTAADRIFDLREAVGWPRIIMSDTSLDSAWDQALTEVQRFRQAAEVKRHQPYPTTRSTHP